MSAEIDIRALELLEEEHRQKREERLLRIRAELGVPLTYDEVELLTGIAKSTLTNWKSAGRLLPTNPDERHPRFLFDDVLRMLGAFVAPSRSREIVLQVCHVHVVSVPPLRSVGTSPCL